MHPSALPPSPHARTFLYIPTQCPCCSKPALSAPHLFPPAPIHLNTVLYTCSAYDTQLARPTRSPPCCSLSRLKCGTEVQSAVLPPSSLITASPLLSRLRNPAAGRYTCPPTPRRWGRTGARSRTRGRWRRHCKPQGCIAPAGSGCWGLGGRASGAGGLQRRRG